MIQKCLFCDKELEGAHGESDTMQVHCSCLRCGDFLLERRCSDTFNAEGFSLIEKRIISIVLRNEHERRNDLHPEKVITLDVLRNIIKQYLPIDPLAKMDDVLFELGKKSKYIGSIHNINVNSDYPYYHCLKPEELKSILMFLRAEGYISAPYLSDPSNDISITVKGYQRLREIMKPGKDSKQCFVAMRFSPEMDEVYEKAIKSAIEFTEKGESSPRFEAIKIDSVEHTNDINDEIIAQIRRSMFMVCDLTGYRGGVYFEAGFAYGLGLEIIYTCREDWCKEQVLKDADNNEVFFLFDDKKNKIEIKKEGVHFDLAHRNRIEWSPDNLEDFRIKLENRIKAVVI